MRTYIFTLLCILSMPVILRAQYQNVFISLHNGPNEPTICIHPKNPDYIVGGANTDNYYYSEDGGYTWNEGTLESSYGVWGDPCVVADTNGDFYFFHLSNPPSGNWIDRIVCQKSTDQGATWSDGNYMGLDGTKAQDKEWAVVDPVTNNIYVTWTQFDDYGSQDPADSSLIMFSRSQDGGQTWSPSVRICAKGGNCVDSDSTVEGAVPAVGPDGEIYVSWAGPEGILFTKSLDNGVTWPEENVFVTDMPGGWDFPVPGIFRTNGLPVTCCDLSNGPHRGTIYINWSDQRNGEDDTDIFLVKSTDGGETWSAPIRVNDDPPGKHQFYTWMTVDQSTGYLWFVFYDRRDLADILTDVFIAVSYDGGLTFQNIRVSESPFTPIGSYFFGDYTNISAVNGRVRPIWFRMNPYMGIYTAIVDSVITGTSPGVKETPFFALDQNYPNPAHGVTWFGFKLHRPTTVSLRIYDVSGKEVAAPMEGRFFPPGKYAEPFNVEAAGLTPGFYFYSLVSGEYSVVRKMLIE